MVLSHLFITTEAAKKSRPPARLLTSAELREEMEQRECRKEEIKEKGGTKRNEKRRKNRKEQRGSRAG